MQRQILLLKETSANMFFLEKGKETLKAVEFINASLSQSFKGQKTWIPKSVIKSTRDCGNFTILKLKSWFINKLENNPQEKKRIKILFGA